jgi:hypothetical protein
MSDLQTAQGVVESVGECRRLAAIAVDPNESAETQLDAAMRSLDLMGVTGRSARFFEHDLNELSLPELHMALVRVRAEIAGREAA